ncbi:unnamed protein product [Rhodiola kirilowii]
MRKSCYDWSCKAGSIGEVDINRLVRRQIKVIGSYEEGQDRIFQNLLGLQNPVSLI